MPSGHVPTFVRGLDELLGGGIIAGNVVLFTRTPGARKTSLLYYDRTGADGRPPRQTWAPLRQGTYPPTNLR